ncbi:MAG: antitoxin VapB family protein [Halobacteriales archaeon]
MRKTIRLNPETYRRLDSIKGADESFDDVIDRLLESKDHPLSRLIGLIDDEDAAELREHSQAFRESLDLR